MNLGIRSDRIVRMYHQILAPIIVKSKARLAKIKWMKILRITAISVILGVIAIWIVAGLAFTRYQQLCRYQSQVDSGRLQSPSHADLCPNLLNSADWPALITNLLSPTLDLIPVSATILDTGETACTDQLDPICLIKNSKSELKQTNGQTNLLIMGIDSRAHGSGSYLKNTDTIMMISLDHATGKLVFVSFPRDLYVYYTRPNGTPTAYKINGVYAIDGIPGIKTVVEQITDKKIHYYAMVDFVLVQEAIDSLGGVTVNVPHDFEELYPCADVPKNRECPRPVFSIDGYFGHFTFKKGKHTFDSFKAMVYARARKYTSDFDRAKRQQDILRAMLDQAINTQVPLGQRVSLYFDLYNKFQKRVITNIQPEDLTAIFKIIDKLDSKSAQIVVDYSLEKGRFITTLGILPEVGWSIGFIDKSHSDFQSYLNSVISNLPYFIEKPRVLIVNASGAKITSQSPVRKITRNNPYLKFKIIESSVVQEGVKLYDLSHGQNPGTLRDINRTLPNSLIFNPQLDQVTPSDFKEDIVIVWGS